MEKHFTIICLVVLVLLVIVLPVAAIPTVIDQGVSTYSDSTRTHLIPKNTWKLSETGNSKYQDQIVVWIRIPPGTDKVNGYTRYGTQFRLITPDGKDFYKDIMQPSGDYYARQSGYVVPTKVGGSMIDLSNPAMGFKLEKYYSSDTLVNEYGGFYSDLQQYPFRVPPTDGNSKPLKPFQTAGLWKVETYINDNNWDQHLSDGSHKPPEATLVSTQTFTIVDDTKTTTSPTSQTTTSPYNPGYVTSQTTTPVPVITSIIPSTAKSGNIEAESYTSAEVQKTGASWDSTEEKCPTWRGNDWSGAGDYYLSHGGDTLSYSFTVPASAKYAMWMRDWSDTNHATGDRQINVIIDGASIGTFDAANSFSKGTTGYGWDKLANIDLSAGSHNLKITKKDTTSSAAIIDDLFFTPDLNEVPQGAIGHTEVYCQATTVTTTVTPITSGITYQPVCTPPICPSGKYVCLQKDGCSGGCGTSCDNSVIPPVSGCSGTGTSVYAESRTMQQGTTVKIPIMVCNANDLANMDLTVNYDTTVLKFKSAEKGGLNANSLFESNEASPGNVMISFASSNGASGSASIAILTFDVIGSNGSTSPIRITVKTASTSSGTTIPVSVSQGTFTTGTPTTITFDGGPVTSRDALAALQMAVGKIPTDMKYDVTKDGSVNSGDARAILKIAVSSQ